MKELSELDIKKLGMKIKLFRVKKDMTQSELGKVIGVSASTIGMYEQGRRQPPFDTLLKLSEIFNVDISDFAPTLLENKEAKISNIKQIPILGTIAAGTPILAEENIEGYFNVDSSIHADFILKIKGDSMINAGIQEGDLVFIKRQCDLENGEIGAILLDNEATLKRFYRGDGSITLVAENIKYPPKVFTNGDISILGKLVAVLSIRE